MVVVVVLNNEGSFWFGPSSFY